MGLLTFLAASRGTACGQTEASHHSEPVYTPGSSFTVTNSFVYSGQLWSLLWRPQLPNGWTLGTVSGDGSPEISGGEILWTGSLPPSPIRMLYTVLVPPGAAEDQQIRAEVEYQFAGTVNPTSQYADPDPLAVDAPGGPAVTHASPAEYTAGAVLSVTNTFYDTNALWSLLWRPRLPSGWTLESVTGDGHLELVSGEILWTGTLPPSPINMVYTVRAPTEAAGAQQIRAEVEYQYAGAVNPSRRFARPNPLTLVLPGAPPAGSAEVIHRAPSQYLPGASVQVTNTFTYTGGLWSLLWRPHLPSGWTLGAVSGDGNIEVSGGEILWTGTLPPSPIAMVYTVQVPSSASGDQQILGEVEYQFAGAVNPTFDFADPNPLMVQEPGGPVITQVTSTQYMSGATLNVTNTFTYTNALWSLLWRPQLPGGWTVEAVSGDGNPELSGGEILWPGSLPPSPIRMVYTVLVPAGAVGLQQIRGEVEYHVAGTLNPATRYASPDPMTVDNPRLSPDLIARWIVAPTFGLPGQSVAVAWNVTNRGPGEAAGWWSDGVFLTKDPNSQSEQILGLFACAGPIAAGGSYCQTQLVTLPSLESGPHWVVVRTDTANTVGEQNETNNFAIAQPALVLPPVLNLSLSVTSLVENAGSNATTAVLSRNAGEDQPLTVTLLCSDTNRLALPGALTIPPGQFSIVFPIHTRDNAFAGGTTNVFLIASASGYSNATASVTLLDDDVPTLSLEVDRPSFSESGGSAAATGTVSRNTDSSTNLNVSLMGDDPSEARVPSSVVILAGQSSVTFPIAAVDDKVLDGDHRVKISAMAARFVSVATVVEVTDDEVLALNLTVALTHISEGVANPATFATVTRSLVDTNSLRVVLSSSDPDTVTVPSEVTIPAGQASAAFPVNAVDDSLVNGTRVVTLLCQAVLQDGVLSPDAWGAATIHVADDDAPALSLRIAATLIREGETAGAIITRNTLTSSNLVVSLHSSDLTEAAVPATVTIPEGQSAAQFAVSAVNDGMADGLQSATITASASGFSESAILVQTTDINYPDLAVVAATPSSAVGFVSEAIQISWTVTNSGLAAATGLWTDSVFISDDEQVGNDTLVTNLTHSTSLAVGESYSRTATLILPAIVGQYWIIVTTDAGNTMAEGVEWNNTLVSAAPIEVGAPYRATVETDVTLAPAGTPIPLRGRAFIPSTSAPVPLKPVTVRIRVNGTRRILDVVTDQNGNFETVFHPLPTEAGHYAVGADHPGVAENATQDTFMLAGVWPTPRALELRLVPNQPASGLIELSNLGDVALTGIAPVLSNAPANVSAQLETPAVLAASATNQLQYRFTATSASPTGAVCVLRIGTAEGVALEIPVALEIVPLAARLAANPSSLGRGMVRGDQAVVSFEVANIGGSASGDLAVALPEVAWMSLASSNLIRSLAPGETTTVTLALRPPADLPLAQYRGTIELGNPDLSLAVSFEFTALSSAVGDLLVTVVDDYTYYVVGAPKVAQARVRLRDAFDQSRILAQAISDVAGLARFTNVAEGVYLLEVEADKHSSVQEACTILPGITNEVEVLLPRQLITYRWEVVPTSIQDHYEIVLETLFETEAPVPVVTIEAPDSVIGPGPGETTQIEVTLTNRGLLAAQEVRFTTLETASYIARPLVSEVGVLPARSAITIPVVVENRSAGAASRRLVTKDSEGSGEPRCSKGEDLVLVAESKLQCGRSTLSGEMRRLCELKKEGNALYMCFPQKGELPRPLKKIKRMVTPSKTETGPSPGGIRMGIRGSIDVKRPIAMLMASAESCRYSGAGSGASGSGFSGGTVYVDHFSTRSGGVSNREKDIGGSGSNICARVTLCLDQNAVMTRSAFVGTFQIDNDQAALPIPGVRLALDIRTLEDVAANDRFFTGAPELAGLTAIDGTGSIAPSTTGSAKFLFIPTTWAATNGPTDYAIGGTLRYLDPESGQEVVVPIFPALITVYPDASLRLKYFQPHDVFSDDPTTKETEPAEPFSLGLLVQNAGLGRARSFSITSAQPRIVDNQKGLLIDFQMIGSQVGTQAVASSLTVALGDIEPHRSQVARWDFISSLQGKFLGYSAEFQHTDELGGLRTSLIESIEIHELTHIVQADRAGDDALMDFLANDLPDPENLPDTLHLSDGITAVVNQATGGTVNGTLAPGHLEVGLTAQVGSGWTYLRVPNPGPDLRLVDVRRSDGRRIKLGSNAWITDRSFPAALTGVRREHLLHLLDYNSTGLYILTYSQTANTPPVLAAIPDQTVVELSTLIVTNNAIDADLPANALRFILVSAPAGVALDPATGVLTWTPSDAQGPSTNVITVMVTDDGVPPLSDSRSFTVVVTTRGSAPAITAEPQSRTNVAGTTSVFCVTASGTPPLSYQWRKDGVNLTDGGNVSGATTTCLTLANVQLADAGGYTVVVTNLAGAVTSTVATLTITEPGIAPAILVQPQSRTNLPGSTANFTVVATGTTPLSYQWLKNGLRLSEGGNVSGTTSTNLTLANVQTSDAGAYQVVVTNTFGSVTSQVAMLAVTSQPDIEAGLLAYYPFDADARDHSGHPEADLSNFGATPALADLRACFSFAPGAYTYHSNFNLTRVPLSISLWFKLRSVQPVGSKLIGNWGFTQPDAYRGFRVAQGSPNSLDLAVGGLPSNVTYESLQACETGRWYHLVACFDTNGGSAYVNGVLRRRVDMALAYRPQAPKLWLGGRGTPSDDWWGDLDGWLDEVRIYDRILQPDEVLLLSQQTNFAPVIVTQPRSRTNVLGTVATFSVNALGTPPLTYQWRKDASNLSDGGNVSGATTATLTLTGVQFGDAGRYSVVVANAAGGVTSQEAVLAVIPPVPLEEGVVVAWGQNNWGQTDVPVGLSNVVAVAAGSMHNLALKNDGTVVGWGGDNYGKTTPPAGLSNAVAVAAGDNHSLALKSDGTVVGWGYNGNGQTNPPPGLSDVVAIAAGYDHNLALTGNGLVVAWGGSPLFGQTNVPASASNVVAISAGQYVSLALRGDGTLVAWGYGSSGETNIPASATKLVAISAGRFHCLALKCDGTVLAWGNNSYGQTNVPVNLTNVVAIAGGAYHSLALQADGTLVGWGWNLSGQTTIPSELGNGNVLAIAARGNHSLALKRQAVLGVAPSIAVQPQSRTNAPGTTATFTVGALGTAPLRYQWQKEGTSLLDGGTISGAASPVLTLASVQTSDVGNYRVVITNAFGSVTSQVATLALTPAVPGNLRWQFFAGDIVASSPAIGADGTIYVGAWNGKVFALNGATGAKSWEFQTADRVHSSPAIGADGTVYVGSYDRKVYALDGTTGAKRWEFATQAAVASCSPAIGVDGTVYVGSQDGRLYALDGATGQQRWAFATGGEVNSSPAIGADGTVYFGSLDGRLYALDGATGAKRWEFLTGNQIHSSPAIGADGTVYVGSYDSKVYALDGATGRLRWTYTTGRYIWCGPTVGPDGTVYVGSHDGNVYALDGATGQRRWVTWTGGYVGSSPAIGADGTLYVASGPGAKLFALDCATGRKLWEFRAGADVSSSVAIGADGTLYFGSHDGQVYALHSGSVGGLAESAWPMFHQNVRHTGSTEAQLPIAPGIVAQPASLTVTVGASGTFGVIATGAAPLTYQWWFNNTALPAATNANFTLSNAGLANAGNYHVVVANAFGSVTSQVATLAVVPSGGSNLLAGVGHDGYVAGGTVFFDANRNGQLDANEPATTTDDQGHFELTVPLDEFDANHNGQLDPAEGCLVLQGGLDIATGQPLRTSLSAPPGSTVVTPLTALLQEMLDQTPGLSVSNAQAQLQAALGVSNRVDLTRYDPFAAAQTNDPQAGPVLRAASQVQDTIVQITALVEGASPAQGADELAGLVTATLAAQLQTNAAFNLSAPTQVENLLTQAVSRAGVTLPAAVTDGAAQIIAEVNQLKAQAADSAPSALDAAGEISRIQGVAQGSIAEELALVGANAKVIDDAVAANTGNALQATVEAAPVGDVTGQETRPGTFAFSQSEFRVAENGTPLTAVTVIRTDGNKGTVGLRITLSDDTARRADGDYTVTNLDLQFGDGEISRTVNLATALTDDAEVEANETIQLTLSLLPGAPPQAQLGAPTQALLTLVDNDPPGTFAFTGAEYRVREDGTTVNAVTIRRDQGSAGVVSLIVTPMELPGGATAGSDFDPTPVVVTFLPGNMNRIVTIPVVADALAEGDESLLLSLALAPGAPSSASLGAQSSAVLTLLDVASAPAWVRLGVLPQGAGGEFKFSLTGTPGRTCVVQTSSNLLAWVNASTNLLTETPLVFTGPPVQSAARRFYRAVLLP